MVVNCVVRGLIVVVCMVVIPSVSLAQQENLKLNLLHIEGEQSIGAAVAYTKYGYTPELQYTYHITGETLFSTSVTSFQGKIGLTNVSSYRLHTGVGYVLKRWDNNIFVTGYIDGLGGFENLRNDEFDTSRGNFIYGGRLGAEFEMVLFKNVSLGVAYFEQFTMRSELGIMNYQLSAGFKVKY